MKVLVKEYYCPVCHNRMKLSNDNSVLDKKLWRCKSTSPKHYIKKNLRINSIFENIKVPLSLLYFITFECFSMNKGINKTLLEEKDLSAQIKEISTTSNTINKIFKTLRNTICINMHKEWKNNLLGYEPSDNGVPENR